MSSPRPWKMIRYFHSTVRNPGGLIPPATYGVTSGPPSVDLSHSEAEVAAGLYRGGHGGRPVPHTNPEELCAPLPPTRTVRPDRWFSDLGFRGSIHSFDLFLPDIPIFRNKSIAQIVRAGGLFPCCAFVAWGAVLAADRKEPKI